MSLDVTLSEEALQRSVKKFILDDLKDNEGIHVSFGTDYSVPDEIDEWAVFFFDGIHYQESIANAKVTAYLFSRRDDEGEALAILRDKLRSLFFDEGSVSGNVFVPLLNDSFSKEQGMVAYYGIESQRQEGQDGTHFRTVYLHFRFGSK